MNLTELLENKEIICVTGKGGTGKSTLSAALSLYYATKSYPVLAMDVDPFHSLPDVFGIDCDHNSISPVYQDLDSLSLMLVSPDEIVEQVEKGKEDGLKNRAEGLADYYEVLHMMSIVKQLGVPVAMRGFAALSAIICEGNKFREAQGPYTRSICDMEPSAATMELLEDSEYAVKRMGVMAEHKRKWAAIARIAGWPDIANFASSSDYLKQIADYKKIFEDFYDTIRDPEKTAFVIVSSPEQDVLKETSRLVREIESRGFPILATVFNKNYSSVDPKKLSKTPLKHWPEQHRKAISEYIQNNPSGKYFSVAPLGTGIAGTQGQKRKELGEFIESVKKINI